MLSSLNPSAQQFLDSLNQIGDNMQRAQQQVSTGLKITQASDAPDSISSLLQARADLSRTEQSLTNLGQTKTETDAGEQALQGAVTLFDTVQTLGAAGASDTQTAATRLTLAQQLDTALQQFVGITGTSVGGRFIFSGDADQTVPYSYSAGAANPVSAYQGSASTRVAQSPNGTTFPIGLTAQQIFDSADPTTNVFTAVKNLSAALKANDSASIQASVDGLAKVSGYLNQQLASYGNIQHQVTSATNFGETLKTQLRTQISGLEDADLTSAILEITQTTTQQQAALQARARMPQQTLFSYLG